MWSKGIFSNKIYTWSEKRKILCISSQWLKYPCISKYRPCFNDKKNRRDSRQENQKMTKYSPYSAAAYLDILMIHALSCILNLRSALVVEVVVDVCPDLTATFGGFMRCISYPVIFITTTLKNIYKNEKDKFKKTFMPFFLLVCLACKYTMKKWPATCLTKTIRYTETKSTNTDKINKKVDFCKSQLVYCMSTPLTYIKIHQVGTCAVVKTSSSVLEEVWTYCKSQIIPNFFCS